MQALLKSKGKVTSEKSRNVTGLFFIGLRQPQIGELVFRESYFPPLLRLQLLLLSGENIFFVIPDNQIQASQEDHKEKRFVIGNASDYSVGGFFFNIAVGYRKKM